MRPGARNLVSEVDGGVAEIAWTGWVHGWTRSCTSASRTGAQAWPTWRPTRATWSWRRLRRGVRALPPRNPGDSRRRGPGAGRRGLHVANLIDHPPLGLGRAEVATARSVFDHVAPAADPATLREDDGGNLVMAGGDGPWTCIGGSPG